MKRIKTACLEQTIHFALSPNLTPSEAVRAARQEADIYRKSIENKKGKCKIVDETTQPDGSVMLKLKKQYLSYPIGDYLE